MKALILSIFVTAASAEDSPWVVYIQENCLPCRKQLKELDCLAEKGISIKVVGIGRSRLRLRHELDRQTQGTFAFEMKSWDEAKRLDIFATPTHERLDASGKKQRLTGIVPCKES